MKKDVNGNLISVGTILNYWPSGASETCRTVVVIDANSPRVRFSIIRPMYSNLYGKEVTVSGIAIARDKHGYIVAPESRCSVAVYTGNVKPLMSQVEERVRLGENDFEIRENPQGIVDFTLAYLGANGYKNRIVTFT